MPPDLLFIHRYEKKYKNVSPGKKMGLVMLYIKFMQQNKNDSLISEMSYFMDVLCKYLSN